MVTTPPDLSLDPLGLSSASAARSSLSDSTGVPDSDLYTLCLCVQLQGLARALCMAGDALGLWLLLGELGGDPEEVRSL